jgi:DNA-binding NarL/FixJ family response regulator
MVRILIGSDFVSVRNRIRAALVFHPDCIVCGDTGNGLKAVLMANELKPDLVILDLASPMLDGLNTADQISRMLPRVPIVIYSPVAAHLENVPANAAGVWAVVSQSENEEFLVETLERLLHAGATPQAEMNPNSSTTSQSNGNQ